MVTKRNDKINLPDPNSIDPLMREGMEAMAKKVLGMVQLGATAADDRLVESKALIIALTYDGFDRESGSVYYTKFLKISGDETVLKNFKIPRKPKMEQIKKAVNDAGLSMTEIKPRIIEVDYDYDDGEDDQ